MPIQVLPPDLAAKIAAGEVIERPASVVKELVENALDAGATTINVEIREGGQRLIRVADNGCGIPAAEAEIAFARHATSKLQSVDDLSRIRTLGFRGEALPSIAAVTHITFLTRSNTESAGIYLRLEAGELVSRESRGAPAGTIITAEHLFYNIPARRKFLRRPATEAGYIQEIVTRYTLAYPERRFRLEVDGRITFQAPGTGKMEDALIAVYGVDTARQMLLLPQAAAAEGDTPEQVELEVAGFVGPPSLHRANRKDLTFFVNHRWIQDRSLAFAVQEAYHTLLPVGRYPVGVITISIDPAAVDVNVHPSKNEVRFLAPHHVFSAVQRAVRRVVVEESGIPQITFSPASDPWHDTTAFGGHSRAANLRVSSAPSASQPAYTRLALDLHRPLDSPLSLPGAESAQSDLPLQFEPHEEAQKLPFLRVVGQVSKSYIIAEGPEGMYMIDQHAAHERILYEQFMAQRGHGPVASQALLEPVVVHIPPAQVEFAVESVEILAGLGFHLEPFGGDTFLLRTLPALIQHSQPVSLLLDVLQELEEERPTTVHQEREAALTRAVCKRAAVKAGQTLNVAEMSALIQHLESCAQPRTCPHGRPTMIHLSNGQLEREFGRR
ncbi:MAG: DNA mismatch repair endonuclease MutL [Chloroflexi bacterium]|nr:DNA mismatch repair endonuclease MutL [Chloroflexota bacterium]